MKTVIPHFPRGRVLAALSAALVLAGCGTTPPPTVPTAPPRSEALPPLPSLEDPAYQSLLDRVNTEYRRWLAAPASYVVLPPAPAPLPCAVPTAELEKLAGIPDPQDPKILAVYARQERASGMKRGTVRPPGVEGAKVHFIRGHCVKGKLHGEVEMVGEYTSVLHVLENVTRIPQQIVKRYTFDAGKPVGLVYTAQLQGHQQSTRPGSDGIRTLTGSFSLGEAPSGNVPRRGMAISYHRSEMPKPGFGSWVTVTQTVQQTVPLKGDRWKQVSYNGTQKTGETHFKGDVMHGRMNQYGYETTSPFVKGPIRIPASEACYDNGEQIKSAACDVD